MRATQLMFPFMYEKIDSLEKFYSWYETLNPHAQLLLFKSLGGMRSLINDRGSMDIAVKIAVHEGLLKQEE